MHVLVFHKHISLSLSFSLSRECTRWLAWSVSAWQWYRYCKQKWPPPSHTLPYSPSLVQALYNLPLPSACVWSSQTASGAYFKVSTFYTVHSSLKCDYLPHVKYVGHVTVTWLSHGITQLMAISLQSHESQTFYVLVHTQEVDIQSYSQIVGSDHPGAGRWVLCVQQQQCSSRV